MTRIRSSRAASRACGRLPVAGMIAIFLALVATLAAPLLFAASDKADKTKTQSSSKVLNGPPVSELNEDEAILQTLNRLGFGPRPGDVDRVKEMGLRKWIERELHPDSIDDSALQARLERFPTLKMSSAQLLNEFPEPKLAAKREGMTVEEYRKEQQEQMRSAVQSAQDSAQMTETDVQKADAMHMPDFESVDNDLSANPAKQKGQGKGQGGLGNTMFNYEQVQLPQRIVAELSMAKVTRAVYSERQLQEVMVDFWYNHFNVFAAKGADRWLITEYERDSIRPYAMGKFRDLLEATAKSPAMLFYLDNWLSADPVAWQRMQQQIEQRREMRQMRGGPFGGPRFPQGTAPNTDPSDPNAAPSQNRSAA